MFTDLNLIQKIFLISNINLTIAIPKYKISLSENWYGRFEYGILVQSLKTRIS